MWKNKAKKYKKTLFTTFPQSYTQAKSNNALKKMTFPQNDKNLKSQAEKNYTHAVDFVENRKSSFFD